MGNFQSVLKSLRKAQGLTQEELAKVLKISRSTIGMYENGSREPDYETLELIADYFNVDIDYLLGRTNKTTIIPAQYFNNSEATKASHFILSPIEKKIITEYRQADEISRAMVLRALSIDEADYQKKEGSA